MLTDALQKYGLDKRQADIYLLCLEYGTIKPATIAKKLGIHRTTCYDALAAMVSQNILVETQYKNQKHYEAVSPEVLLDALGNKYDSLSKVLPQLKFLSNVYGIKTKIKVFEWFENVKHMYADMLDSETDIKVMMWFEVENDDFLDWRDTYFVPERVARKISISVISYKTELSEKYKKLDRENLRETRFMKDVDVDLKCWWFLYDTCKCLIIIYDDKHISGVIIESKAIHDLWTVIFDQLRVHI